MEVLTLNVNKWAFDKISSGEKKEEYREVKQYWQNRLMRPEYFTKNWALLSNCIRMKKEWTHILFINGYGKNKPSVMVEFKNLSFKKPKPEWCPEGFIENDKMYFALELGDIIKK